MSDFKKNPPQIKISVKLEDSKVTAKIPFDSSFEEVMDTLNGLLVAQGYHKDCMTDYIKERSSLINEENEHPL